MSTIEPQDNKQPVKVATIKIKYQGNEESVKVEIAKTTNDERVTDLVGRFYFTQFV